MHVRHDDLQAIADMSNQHPHQGTQQVIIFISIAVMILKGKNSSSIKSTLDLKNNILSL
jgi:hypothetical protein